MRLACLHTAESNVGVFERAAVALGTADVTLDHVVREDLLAAAEAAGRLTDDIEAATVSVLESLVATADGVLLTCSTLGPATARWSDRSGPPVLRVDRALAEQATAAGGKVAVLCAVETTGEPTRQLFQQAARGMGAEVTVLLVDGAWELFKRGDVEAYHRSVAAAASEALRAGADVVALAQASMSGAESLCENGTVLASPTAGLAALIRAVHPE
ncbi:MAG TPA: aspartate/glutamate racemase family protein [Ilumatobacter sp.]|nr:aspartate/glutamate racemase family protein [Ilumatobacter sp.]